MNQQKITSEQKAILDLMEQILKHASTLKGLTRISELTVTVFEKIWGVIKVYLFLHIIHFMVEIILIILILKK